ncbi:sporulation integral membrane protein YtvI [Candidatus Clostridium stratigraminis]|uniref:Sporulation integral membrane protein YtvI n=1 Tax=Candidatus Clostridium stratigraminis TaxID=3381661 RepID=A0ABW8T7J9_9CLOT
MDKFLEKIDRLLIFVVIYTAVFLIFFKTLPYILPFVLAFIFSLILQKPTKYLIAKLKLKNVLASIITTFFFFAIILSILSLIMTSLISELIQLGRNTQQYFIDTSSLTNILNYIKDYYNRLDPSLVNGIQSYLTSFIAKISSILTSLVSGTVTWLLNLIASIPSIIMVILFTFLSTYFFTKELSSAKTKVKEFIPFASSDKLLSVFKEGKKMLGNYLISYSIIIFITFIETLIGFLFFKVKYALLLSIICAIADILPILGIGIIYLPVAVIYYFSNQYVIAIGILILYILVSIIRQIIEPKIVSSSLGIHPVPILAAIFIGLKINGIAGMFFFIFLVVFYTIFKKVNVL